MKLLQGAIHIFTDRPDLAVAAFCRELNYQANHRAPYEKISESVVIKYPNAVSYFGHFGLSNDYIAKMYSKKRKAPVVVSIVGRILGLKGIEPQALRLYWGLENKCIAQIETISDGRTISVECEGIDVLKDKLAGVIPGDSILFTPLGEVEPLKVASILSDELGIFLGDVPLEDYLKKCVLKKELELGRVYEAAPLGEKAVL